LETTYPSWKKAISEERCEWRGVTALSPLGSKSAGLRKKPKNASKNYISYKGKRKGSIKKSPWEKVTSPGMKGADLRRTASKSLAKEKASEGSSNRRDVKDLLTNRARNILYVDLGGNFLRPWR